MTDVLLHCSVLGALFYFTVFFNSGTGTICIQFIAIKTN